MGFEFRIELKILLAIISITYVHLKLFKPTVFRRPKKELINDLSSFRTEIANFQSNLASTELSEQNYYSSFDNYWRLLDEFSNKIFPKIQYTVYLFDKRSKKANTDLILSPLNLLNGTINGLLEYCNTNYGKLKDASDHHENNTILINSDEILLDSTNLLTNMVETALMAVD